MENNIPLLFDLLVTVFAQAGTFLKQSLIKSVLGVAVASQVLCTSTTLNKRNIYNCRCIIVYYCVAVNKKLIIDSVRRL